MTEEIPLSRMQTRPREKMDLSQRQRQILERRRMGKTNKETASDLRISVNTVKQHIRITLMWLGCRNVPEALFRLAPSNQHLQIAGIPFATSAGDRNHFQPGKAQARAHA